MDKGTIAGWLEELRWEYVVLKEPPPSYDYAAAIKHSRIIVLLHKNTGIVELQYTTQFVDEVAKRFFKMAPKEQNRITIQLKEALVRADIRHKIITHEKKSFFGFSLGIYLPGDPIVTDLLNSSSKMLEIKDLVESIVASKLV